VTIYQSGRASLVFIGASVCWGLGNELSQQYTTIMQRQIDQCLGESTGGWTARNIHTDDWQDGQSVASAPFNAGPTDQGPNFGCGSAGGTSPCGHGKLHFDRVAPIKAPVGIFSAYAGAKTPSGSPYAAYTDPMVRLGAGSNIGFKVNAATCLILGLTNSSRDGQQGQVAIFSSWKGATPEAVVSVDIKNAIERFAISLSNPTTEALQALSIVNISGSVDVSMIWPTRVQAANHIAVQVIARDSYCLQDYLADVLTPDGSQVAVTDLIKQSIVNPDELATSSRPWYVILDTYNSMVTGASEYGVGDRRLDPSTYITQLEMLAARLSSGRNAGNIIATMPVIPGKPPLFRSGPCSGPLDEIAEEGLGIGWLPGIGSRDYREAIAAAAQTNGWLFVDQSVLPSLTTPAFFWGDGIHPQPTGMRHIAQLFIERLGLAKGAKA